MKSGYVYIVSNTSMPGLIKIGQTKLSAEERARKLSSHSGVPSPFRPEFEIWTFDRVKLEKIVHHKLEYYRINKRREFFNIELDKAIEIVEAHANEINKRGYPLSEMLISIRDAAIKTLSPFVKK